MSILTIELTPDEEQRLDAEARRRGTDRQSVARAALEQLFSPAAHDIMEFADARRWRAWT